jgi:hypothetical protein
LREATKAADSAWLLLHHRRKNNIERSVSLGENPHEWLQESAGSLALVNHTDSRLGVEPSDNSKADLILGGFVRSQGALSPIHLAREYDSGSGRPVGYQPLLGLSLLSDRFQEVYMKLKETFTYTDVNKALGGASSSNSQNFLKQTVNVGLAKANGKNYVKVVA